MTTLKNQLNVKSENGTGYSRFLVISHVDGNPRPVWRTDRKNKNNPDAGTYQRVEEKDLVIRSRFIENETPNILFFEVEKIVGEVPQLKQTDTDNLYMFIKNINPVVTDWLTDKNNRQNLPAGIGWDGVHSELEILKLNKALSFLPAGVSSDIVDRYTRAAFYTAQAVFGQTFAPVMRTHYPSINTGEFDTVILTDQNDDIVVKENTDEVINIDENIKQVVTLKYHKLSNSVYEQVSLQVYNYI